MISYNATQNKTPHLSRHLNSCGPGSTGLQPPREEAAYPRPPYCQATEEQGRMVGRGTRIERKVKKEKKGAKMVPLMGRPSFHLGPKGMGVGQPSESKAPRTGPPYRLGQTVSSLVTWLWVTLRIRRSRIWWKSKVSSMLSATAVLGNVTKDLQQRVGKW